MKTRICALLAVLFLGAAAFKWADFPETEISNNMIKARILLPDVDKGYYRGVRFDWGGVIPSLEYKGHSYFGTWNQSPYDPKLHDAIMGPVEEFVALGFDDAKAGDEFVKIGVGGLIKPDDKKYSFATRYEIKNPGKWEVKKGSDQVTFTHTLKSETGYGYVYQKILKLVKGKPQLVLEHTLKNTGAKPIETSTYNHNFFMIDNEPSGENIRIVFPFEVQGEGSGFGTIIHPKGQTLTYSREVVKGDQVFSAGLKGYGPTAKDYDIRIENTKTKAGVRITSDLPIDKLVYWACPTTSCPEPYVKISAQPGKDIKWTTTYDFYTF